MKTMWSNQSAMPSTPTQRITGTYALNAQKEGTNEDHTCNTARLTQV